MARRRNNGVGEVNGKISYKLIHATPSYSSLFLLSFPLQARWLSVSFVSLKLDHHHPLLPLIFYDISVLQSPSQYSWICPAICSCLIVLVLRFRWNISGKNTTWGMSGDTYYKFVPLLGLLSLVICVSFPFLLVISKRCLRPSECPLLQPLSIQALVFVGDDPFSTWVVAEGDSNWHFVNVKKSFLFSPPSFPLLPLFFRVSL